MPRQIADDPGRQHRRVWLGGDNHRWAWDWSLEEWGVAFVAWVVLGTLLTWVVPVGLLYAYLAYRVARRMSRGLNPDSPRNYFRLIIGLFTVAALLISLNPLFWLKPLWFPLALAGSLLIPGWVVKRAKPVDWNRPIIYWIRLPFRVASGPRLASDEVIDPTPLALGMDFDRLSDETGDLVPGHLPVKATITKAPRRATKVDPFEKRLVPLKGQHSTKHIARTERGIRIFNTEYRVEGRY